VVIGSNIKALAWGPKGNIMEHALR